VPNSKLPARPSLEYLRKLAKERLTGMRRTNPRAQLATALLTVAQEHGFSNWRVLRAEIDQQNATDTERFFCACKQGDIDAVRTLLRANPTLTHARDTGHNASGLHFAATAGHLETVRTLLDAGIDVHGDNDIHELGVIGWVTHFRAPEEVPMTVVSLLIDRGARHHTFSAIALGDLHLVRTLVEQSPEALDRRMSRLEHGQTPLHFAITRKRGDILGLLIELGADIEAADNNGQTALEFAMLRGDRAAAARLLAAGATKPAVPRASDGLPQVTAVAASVQKGVPVIRARDIAATLRWYASIGFTEIGRYPADGTTVFWGMVSLGRAELMFERGTADANSATLLFVTDRIQDVYQFLRPRQLEAADAALLNHEREGHSVEFVENLHEPVFGGRQFSIRDPNGYTLRFLQEESRGSPSETR
jgi:ankyrin repeat protein/catechol 2,3-dioxygenase-like lactoylglutathione lyase family enzyme